MLAVSITSPYAGLLAVAATVPLADYIGIILDLGSYRLGEAVTIAFLSGWLIRGETGRPGPRVAGGIGWALAVAIVASMVGTAVRFPGALREAANWAFYGYYLSVDPGWVDGARLLEGIALVVAVFAMFRRRPQLAVALPAALTIAATAAGATSILLWYRVAPAVILQRHALIGYRYTAHVADVNAAGSYFALSVCLALAMAAPRARPLAGAVVGGNRGLRRRRMVGGLANRKCRGDCRRQQCRGVVDCRRLVANQKSDAGGSSNDHRYRRWCLPAPRTGTRSRLPRR